MGLVSDSHWAVIGPLIPRPRRRRDRRGRPWKPARDVLDGIVWILRTGAPWRFLPDCYPSYQTCHRRFQQWRANGVLRQILRWLAIELGVGCGDEAFIDGTYVPAKRGGLCVGRCRAGMATKVMAIADGKRPSRRRQDGRALRRARRRWLVERLFAWLKAFRRLACRWEARAENYLGLLHLGCIMILLRQW